MDSLPEHVEIVVPHVQQKNHWDCGLACTLMTLRYFNKPHEDFGKICKEMNFGDSVWTIDLANLMLHYGIKHKFTTITMGVDKGYSSKGFYRAHFSNDEKRVNNLFKNAPSLGIICENKSVALEELLAHLATSNIVMSLVDWSYLTCKWCDHRCLPTSSIGCLPKCVNTYQGHFIIVCGYDVKERVIYFKNPSFKEDLCCCTMKSFEMARKSYGTDEDILFIYNEDKTLTEDDS